MANKTLFVRILPKTGPETFFRCGMKFSRAWKKLEVDKATAERLESEQMLEATEEEPEDYVPEADAATDNGAGGGVPVKVVTAAKTATTTAKKR